MLAGGVRVAFEGALAESAEQCPVVEDYEGEPVRRLLDSAAELADRLVLAVREAGLEPQLERVPGRFELAVHDEVDHYLLTCAWSRAAAILRTADWALTEVWRGWV